MIVKKRILSVIMALAMTASLAACGSGADSESQDAAALTEATGNASASGDANASGDASGDFMEAGMAAGGGGPVESAPSIAAIYISNNAEDKLSEDASGVSVNNYNIKEAQVSGEPRTIISELDMTGSSYTTNGIVVTGEGSNVAIEDSTIIMNTDDVASSDATGGDAVIIDAGAVLNLSRSEVIVNGAQRHTLAAYNDATMIVTNSTIKSTGSVGDNDADVTEPRSNGALLIYGMSRANFSIGATDTYYYNSICDSEGWGALSTDSAKGDGLDLYAVNSYAISRNGGYGAYADTDCRLWLYGTQLSSGEIGIIVSKTGSVTSDLKDNATADALTYYERESATATDLDYDKTIIAGRRNALMLHAPDMMGEGVGAASIAQLDLSNTILTTDTSSEYLKDTATAEDYAGKYGDAIGAYVDYITGADILIKSTSADIKLANVEMTASGDDKALIKTVINSDSMSNYLLKDDEDAPSIDVVMNDMTADGNIIHMDYQRDMNLTLGNGAELNGSIVGGDKESWDAIWTEYANDENAYWILDESAYRVDTHGVSLVIEDGAVWNVTEDSNLTGLTVKDGGEINGKVTVDGKEVTPEAGKTYTGDIVVTK